MFGYGLSVYQLRLKFVIIKEDFQEKANSILKDSANWKSEYLGDSTLEQLLEQSQAQPASFNNGNKHKLTY